MDKFKQCVIVESISGSLISGRMLSCLWAFPKFVMDNDIFLHSLFGTVGLNIYKEMSDTDKTTAIKWFETHGIETSKMFGSKLMEDSTDCVLIFDLQKLYDEYPEVYSSVVLNVVAKTYGKISEKAKGIITDEFMKDPKIFTDAVLQNMPNCSESDSSYDSDDSTDSTDFVCDKHLPNECDSNSVPEMEDISD